MAKDRIKNWMRKQAKEGNFENIPAEFVNKLKEEFKKKQIKKEDESV